MNKPRAAPVLLRGLIVQIFAITILPLTLPAIAFGSYSLHQSDMQTLVSERAKRAVQSAMAALEAELHHRMANISSLAMFANTSENPYCWRKYSLLQMS